MSFQVFGQKCPRIRKEGTDTIPLPEWSSAFTEVPNKMLAPSQTFHLHSNSCIGKERYDSKIPFLPSNFKFNEHGGSR